MLITCFNVANKLTTNNASNILSDFPHPRLKISHGFTMNKTKIMVLAMDGKHKLTMVLLLQIIQSSIKIIFFCGYKNRPKPTTAFKITFNLLYKRMRQ